MLKKKIIIFDFDGTLVDSFGYVVEAFNSVSEKYNLKKVPTGELEVLRNLSSREFLKELNVSFWKIFFVVRAARKELGKQIDGVKLFVGIENVLAELKKRGYVLCVLTSNSQENIDYFFKKNNSAIFDGVYGGCGLFGKRRFMKKILKKYNCNASEAISVGDETRDIEAAKKCKIISVAVSWGFNSKNILEKFQPDFLVDRPEELLKII